MNLKIFHTALFLLAIISIQHAPAQNSCFYKVYLDYIWYLNVPYCKARILPDGSFQHYQYFNKYSIKSAHIGPEGSLLEKKEFTGLITANTDGLLYNGDQLFRASFASGNIVFSELDDNGKVLSVQNYPVPSNDTLNILYMIQTDNGERFILARFKNLSPPTGFILKTDASGSLQWSKTFLGWPSTNILQGISRFDGGLTLLYYLSAGLPAKYQLIQIDTNGDVTIPPVIFEDWFGHFITLARDGGVFIDPGQASGGLRKLDRNGVEEWHEKNNLSLFNKPVYNLLQTSDSNFICIKEPNEMVKFDRNLKELWRRSYPFQLGILRIYNAFLYELEDKTIWAQGAYGPLGPSQGVRFWDMHTDSNGNLDCALVSSPDVENPAAAPSIFPNPTSQALNIQWPVILENELIQVAVYDLQGRMLYSRNDRGANLGTLFLPDQAKGMYLLKWTSGKGEGVLRFFLE